MLFEQAAMTLVREMPVLAVARFIGITDKRLWRIVEYYVAKALRGLDLSGVVAFAFDETASKRGHNYVTVFIDADRKSEPVIFATPGKGKATVTAFKRFLREHGGEPGRVKEVVCDMSPAFLAAVGKDLPGATVTVDWFHVVHLFTKAVDDVRKAERRLVRMPAATRWAVLKAPDGGRLTEEQAAALGELETGDFLTAKAWRIKEKLRWVRRAETPHAARWRLSRFLRHAHPAAAARCGRAWAPGGGRDTPRGGSTGGPRPTATLASKPSTACSRRPPPRGLPPPHPPHPGPPDRRPPRNPLQSL